MGGLVSIWELDMNLGPTLLYSEGIFFANICIRVGPRFMSSSQINTRPPFSIDTHFAKS